MAPKAMVPSGGGLCRRNSRRTPMSRSAPMTVRRAEPMRGRSNTARAPRTGAAAAQRARRSPVEKFTPSARTVGEHGGIGAGPLGDLEAPATVHRDVRAVLPVDRRRSVGAPEDLALVVQARVIAL